LLSPDGDIVADKLTAASERVFGRKREAQRADRKKAIRRTGNPAVIGQKACRPEALRPRLSAGLPLQ
jgi:gamma-glutamylcysteine synthetase